MVTYKLHLVRHGMTMGNLEGRYVGRMDIPVCADGVKELKALMEKHNYPAVQEVYTSPLIRCRQTADILFPDTSRGFRTPCRILLPVRWRRARSLPTV